VTALQAQVLDVRAGGLRHAQPVEREQGDQRMLGSRAEPGGDQERAELVAVQGGGVRLVVQPGAADVRGGRVVEEFFLDGVLVEPGDGAQPPGHGGAGPTLGLELGAKLSMSARRTENSGRDRARHQPVNWRRSSVYASRVRPRYPARKPAIASRSAWENTGWTGTREVEGIVAAIGHLRGQPDPGGRAAAGQSDGRCPQRMTASEGELRHDL
jgi:hypothetical protein